jgi:iron complex transport system ATP-binding protein
VVVAMALAQEPEALLLDEPTVHLDPRHQREVLELVGALARETGVLVLSVFHDLNLAATTCDRIVVLRDGRVARDGTPREVIEATLVESVFGSGLDVGVREGVPFVLPGRQR